MKYVYIWEFNYDLIAPNYSDVYGHINYDAEDVLKNGWNPSYLYGTNSDKNIVKKIDKIPVDSFEVFCNSKFIHTFSDEYYYEVVDEKIFDFTVNNKKVLHILVKKHKV